MNFAKNKILYISLAVILIVLLVLLIVFSKKSTDAEKKKDKENNYTLVFEYERDNFLAQELQFVYKEKKLSTVKLTMFFKENNIAGLVADEYKNEGSFKDVTNTDNSVTVTYGTSLMKEYKGLSKDELKVYLENQGYKMKK